MVEDNPFSRRKVLKLSGATAVAAVLAGCGDEGPGEEEEDPAANGEDGNGAGGNGNGAGGNGEDGNGAGGNGEDGNGAGGNGEDEENGNGAGGNGEDEENGGGDGEAIEPDTDIELNAQTQAWEGIAPSEIEGEENPTITLEEGEDYTIGWPEESDGATHNIEIRDDSDEVVDDLETEESDEPSEDQVLEFTASSEMTQYVCNPHEGTMVGDIEVQ